MPTIPHKLAALFHSLEEHGCGPIRPSGGEYSCNCPAHADNSPSLYVAQTEDRILVRCSAGCTTDAVCDALDYHQSDLFLSGDEPTVEYPAAVKDTTLVTATNAKAAATNPPADDEKTGYRHDVYTALLAALELSTAHFDALTRRGLPPDEIITRGYRTADAGMVRKAVDGLLKQFTPEQLSTVPGFVVANGKVTAKIPTGLAIPVRSVGGNIAALKVRREDGEPGGKYVWVSSPSNSIGNVAHVPLGINAPRSTARLTEGELKADIATVLSNVPTISAPGVNNWEPTIPVLRELGVKKVLLAMDRDNKPNTLVATEKALYGLAKAGFEVELEVWDGAKGKGIDDYLAAGGKPETLTGLAAAVRLRDELAGPQVDQAGDANPEPEPTPFPLDVLPPRLADYCAQVAAATATPADFAATTLLVTAASAIGNSRAIEVKSNAWVEGPRFYLANVGDPASGKTPAMDLVVQPYQAMQQKLVANYKAAKDAYDRDVAAAKAGH